MDGYHGKEILGSKLSIMQSTATREVGAQTNARIKWPGYHIIKKEEAMKFTVETFYQGDWISASGSPVHLGL
ncbi:PECTINESTERASE [Salix viminalis]|uniref:PECTINESTERASE n=1 Tax=Salix viminalis TaxID=40686 RepID=A0A9Q0V619_SALVM|nr:PECTINESTERASE [Salix viminalis]